MDKFRNSGEKTTARPGTYYRLVPGILIALSVFFLDPFAAQASATVEKLMVEYTRTPLGIDVKAPRFSWQMTAAKGVRGAAQTAYRIVVKDPEGSPVWDTKKANGSSSLGIVYAGASLRPATRYTWSVTVWDQTGAASTASSWFETGLMNPDPGLSAWEGATWIGGGGEDLVLYAQYLPLFHLSYRMAIAEGSSRAGFILAANDSRLMDKNKNVYQLEKGRNESYFKVELDISGLDGTENGRARLNIYRAGYTPSDVADKPIKSFDIKSSVINSSNKNREHKFHIRNQYGELFLTLNDSTLFAEPGKDQTEQAAAVPAWMRGRPREISVNLNPMGRGHDYITMGLLCDIGFALEPGQKASFSDIEVKNFQRPNNLLFREDLTKAVYDGLFASFTADAGSGLTVARGSYRLDGGRNGVLITADPSRNAMPMLRTEFTAQSRKIRTARLYVTARGIYEIYLNGKRVGDDHYNPGLTQYNVTHLYQTYDVSSMLHSGQNAMGAMLAEGWWSGMLSFGTNWNFFGDRQSLLAKLVITYEDGSRELIVTNDRDWTYFNRGPVVYSSLDMGEIYDATREAAIRDWSLASYDDREWKKAVRVPLEGTANIGPVADFRGVSTDFNFNRLALVGQIGNTAGVFKTLTARSVKEVRKGVFVYDMGQNLVGVPHITFPNGKAGNRITLRVSEMLYPNLPESGNNVGMIMTENYRAALCQDVYIMKDGPQVFQPRFTSRGYQYIEITGIGQALPLEAVKGVAISSILELSANYETSNEKVNQLWSNLVWSNVDNFLSVPTDCPQRNERMGWSGDISVFSRTATYISNSDQFLRRHLLAMRDVQLPSGKFTDIAPVGGGFGGVLWGSAGITVPWEAYLQYNDVELLKEHYPAMKSYMAYLESTLSPETGLSSDGTLGDWLGPQNNQLGTAFLVTAYHVFDLEIMTKVAEVLGEQADAEKYRKAYEERKAFFNKKFVAADRKTLGLVGGGFGAPNPQQAPEWKVADTQTSYAVGLALGAFSKENIPHMAANLKAAVERENKDDGGVTRPPFSLMTGFIGTAWISKALSDHGYHEQAYKLLQNSRYPSWLYSIEQGATTIWERLNGYTVENGFGGNNSMNSFNHYSFGAVGQWMMAYSLGIQRDEPGFKKFILQPTPDPGGQMTWARGHYDSMYGRIASAWKVENGTLSYEATVPANTTATLYLPAASAKTVTEGGKPAGKTKGVTFLKHENGKAVYELKSGDYRFTSRL